jgi:hypothetical protein
MLNCQTRRLRFTSILRIVCWLGFGSFAACQSQQQAMVQQENGLAAAGFIVRIANTAERQAMMHRLPPNQFVQRVNGNTIHYIYADPFACGCLYIGSQQAYDAYMSNVQADYVGEQKLAAQAFYDAAWNWAAWGPWGPLGPIYGPAPGW